MAMQPNHAGNISLTFSIFTVILFSRNSAKLAFKIEYFEILISGVRFSKISLLVLG